MLDLSTIVIDLNRPPRRGGARKTAGAGGKTAQPVRPVKPAEVKHAGKKERHAARVKDPVDNYIPRRRVTYIGRQHCEECGKTVEYIAGDLLEYVHRDRVAGVNTIRTRAFARSDYRWTSLPRAVEWLDAEPCTCAECLRMERTLENAITAIEGLSHPDPVQIPLFL